MSVFDKLEKWRDGTIRYIERDNKGHFKSSSDSKFYIGQNVGVWNKEPQQKMISNINRYGYYEFNLLRDKSKNGE